MERATILTTPSTGLWGILPTPFFLNFQFQFIFRLTLVLLDLDLSSVENSVDPDHLASKEAI